ncbi:MAG: alpha/beta hydrolase [Gammaproteobacteria bacterium]|nr:MAG: alpha/beta hydrolase [Gammaproteobacteria bacterium]RLA23404.1 MAG: alpha/beta hydrolase [Gammaproteobacteria bacterium]
MNNPKDHPVELEIIFRQASTPSAKPPLIFIHGAYVAAWCWDEFFLSYFASKGHDVYAFSLRGHGKSGGYSQAVWTSLNDYVEDLCHVVSQIDGDPIIVGHSMGGMVLQKYLEKNSCQSAILMASVPHEGLLGPSLSMAALHPLSFFSFQSTHYTGQNAFTPMVGQSALFHRDMHPADVQKYLSRMQSISTRAVHDMSWLSLPRKHNPHNVPMLVLAAENDALFSINSQRATAKANNADFDSFPDMSHAMMLEPDWQLVADKIVEWV